MSDGFTLIADCFAKGDSKCLKQYAGTDEFNYFLDWFEKKGIKKDEVLLAVSIEDPEKLGKLSDLTVDLVNRLSYFHSLLTDNKYVDAVSYIVSNPDLVGAISIASGKDMKLDDIVEDLVATGVSHKPSSAPEFRRVAITHPEIRQAYISGLRKSLVSIATSNPPSQVISILHSLMGTLTDKDEKEVLASTVILLLSNIKEADEKTLSDLLNLAKSLGVITQSHEEKILEDAKTIETELASAVVEALFNKITSAIESQDANTLEQLVNDYKEILDASPLYIQQRGKQEPVPVPGITVSKYLMAIIKYIRSIQPLLRELANTINEIQSSTDQPSPDRTIQLAGKLRQISSSLLNHTDTLGLLRYIALFTDGKETSLSQAIEDEKKTLGYYQKLADYMETMAKISLSCNEQSCDVNRVLSQLEELKKFFGDPDFGDAYKQYHIIKLLLTGTLSDVMSLFGSGPGSEYTKAGLTLNDILATHREQFTRLVIKVVDEGLRSNDPVTRRNALLTLDIALSRGINGTLREYKTVVNVLESVSKTLIQLSNLEEQVSVSTYIQHLDQAISQLEKLLESNKSVLAKYQTKEGTLYDSLRSVINGLRINREMANLWKDLSIYINEQFEMAKHSAYLQNRVLRDNIIPRMLEYEKQVVELGRKYGVPTDTIVQQVRSQINMFKDLQHAVSYVDLLEGVLTNIVNYMTQLDIVKFDPKSGSIQVNPSPSPMPPERKLAIAKAIAIEWGNITYSLQQFQNLEEQLRAKYGSDHQITKYASTARESIKSYLSALKTLLIHYDLRFEDWLGSREHVKIEYSKPYIDAPVLRELEKYVKIGITVTAEELGRVPVVGPVLGSFWTGFADAVTALAKPYELFTFIQYVGAGAQELGRKLLSGDLAGAWSVISTPVYEAVTRDPARFAGSLAGAITLGIIGKSLATKIASKFNVPKFIKLDVIIVNLLQADPLGLGIDYIVGPLAKTLIRKIDVVYDTSLVMRHAISKPLALIHDAVSARIAILGRSIKHLSYLISILGKDLQEIYTSLNNIKNKRGINYLLALRNRLLELDEIQNRLKALAKIYSEIQADPLRRHPIVLMALSGVDDNIIAFKNLINSLNDLRNATGIQVDPSRFAKYSLRRMIEMRDVVSRIAREIRDFHDKLSASIREYANTIKAKYPDLYKSFQHKVDYLYITRHLDVEDGLKTIADLIADISYEHGLSTGRELFSLLADALNKHGLTEFSETLRKELITYDRAMQLADLLEKTGFKKAAASVRNRASRVLKDYATLEGLLKKLETEHLTNILKKMSGLPGVDTKAITTDLSEGVARLKIAHVVKALDNLVSNIEQAVKIASSIDVLDVSQSILRDAKRAIDDFSNTLRSLELDKYKDIQKGISELDALSNKIGSLVRQVEDTINKIREAGGNARVLIELAESLKLNDIALSLRRGIISVDEAVETIADTVARKSLSELIEIVPSISKHIEKIKNTPQFYVMRGLLSNLSVKLNAKLPDMEIADKDAVVSQLKALRDKLSEVVAKDPALGHTFNKAIRAVDNAINKPTIGNLLGTISELNEILGNIDPVKIGKTELYITQRIIDHIENTLKKIDDPNLQLPNVKSMLESVQQAKKTMSRLETAIEARVEMKLVDPGMLRALEIARTELKKTYKLLGGKIDNAYNTIQRFIELLDQGKFDEALAMTREVKNAGSLISRLGMLASIKEDLLKHISGLRDKLKSITGKEREKVKALDTALNDMNNFLQRAQPITPGWGFISSSLEDVIGFSIKAPLEKLDDVINILSVRNKNYRVRIGNIDIGVTRVIERNPFYIKLQYTFDTPVGNAVMEVAVYTVEYSQETGRVVNNVVVNTWFDPPLAGTTLAKQLGEQMSAGIDFLRRIDPDIDALSKIVTYTPVETTLKDVFDTASKVVGYTLLATTVMPSMLAPEIRYVYSQQGLEKLINQLPVLNPVPKDLYEELLKLGFAPKGMIDNLVVGDFIRNPPMINIRFIELELPTGEKLVVPYIPSLGKVLVVPPRLDQKGATLEKPIVDAKATLEQIAKRIRDLSYQYKEIYELTTTTQELARLGQIPLATPTTKTKGILTTPYMPTPPPGGIVTPPGAVLPVAGTGLIYGASTSIGSPAYAREILQI